jgi:hypothetical protein
MGELEERETIRAGPGLLRGQWRQPQSSRIASSKTEVGGEGLHGDRQAHDRERRTAELRRGNGVRRQLEYGLASFVKEMKKGEGSDG